MKYIQHKIHHNPRPTHITKVTTTHSQNQIRKLTAKPATTSLNHSTTQKNPQPKSQNSSCRTHNQRKSSQKINPPPLTISVWFKINKTSKKPNMLRNPKRRWTTMLLHDFVILGFMILWFWVLILWFCDSGFFFPLVVAGFVMVAREKRLRDRER